MKLKTSRTGFTLIELLVVISVIAILISMITVSFVSAQKQARDANRKSDLSQYRTTLEMYANKNNGLYPAYPSRIDPVNLCGTLGVGSGCPDDPKYDGSSAYYYSYISDGTAGNSDATQYVLWGPLENAPASTYWVVCSAGKSGTVTVKPSSGVCPI